ncbi:MAG: hypothetical protein PHX87_04695 [Candidatus Peribacteraceae bacterium]|nr:hypothetical protein [Candidatus Peribacteraceae bacterium]MDD5742696.1 hypothetical protein [Candidatus Peribacteraceae bacterium]
MSDLAEYLLNREEQFQKSPARERFALSPDQWRATIHTAIASDPRVICKPLQADCDLGSGMSLGEGVLIPTGSAERIQTFAASIADQANRLLPDNIWSPGRISRHFTYFRDPATEEFYVLTHGLSEALSRQAYPPLIGLGG